MTVALYMDEHVPRAITVALRLRAVDVVTIQDDDRQGASDEEVLDRASELGRVLFSRDVDLLIEAQHRQACGASFTGLIYAHQLRASVGDCVRDLALIAHHGCRGPRQSGSLSAAVNSQTMIRVNDQYEIDYRPGLTVQDILDELKFSFRMIVVKIDGKVVLRKDTPCSVFPASRS